MRIHGIDIPSGESIACRALNVAVACVGLALAGPLMLVIAALVKLTSPGPVFYRQVRVGLDRRAGRAPGDAATPDERDAGGKPFTILKFRTMQHCDASKERQVWAAPDDPRITPLGSVLRRFRLDELPQLINVLRGDMNVVGPRPEQPQIVQRLRRAVSGYGLRHCVRPGITGLAQTMLGYDQSVDDVRRKVALDLEYVRRRSALHDLSIMLRTPSVMLGRRGAI
ncbi:MAG TPA: sugar transferase [Gemmatimonadaceae bacterium]|nr:sugar transferase [Gemmatimonadaceae bacterium]